MHGQTHGGIAQGVGQALWEQCYVDPDSGQPLTGSFMDYAMPRADTLPSFKTEIVEVLSPTNPLGIKAGGEGGTTPALAVVVNAIVDALRDFGVRDITMPATPDTIWQAIQDAKAAPETRRRPAPTSSMSPTAAARPRSPTSLPGRFQSRWSTSPRRTRTSRPARCSP